MYPFIVWGVLESSSGPQLYLPFQQAVFPLHPSYLNLQLHALLPIQPYRGALTPPSPLQQICFIKTSLNPSNLLPFFSFCLTSISLQISHVFYTSQHPVQFGKQMTGSWQRAQNIRDTIEPKNLFLDASVAVVAQDNCPEPKWASLSGK